MPTIATSQLSLHLTQTGTGPQPVVLVHGSFATSRWWEPLLAALPMDEFTGYAFDLPGCGQSGWPQPDDAYAIAAQAEVLAAALAALDLWQVHLVGHSLGAAIALTLAVTQPARVASLTLISAPSPNGTPTPPEGYALLEQMRNDRDLLAQALASTMPSRAPDAFFQTLVDDAQRQAPAAFQAAAWALETWRLPAEQLAQVRLPVLLMWGDRDQIVEREDQVALLLALPGADNLEVLRGCGHTPILERPVDVARLLLAFLGQDFAAYAALREQAAAQEPPV